MRHKSKLYRERVLTTSICGYTFRPPPSRTGFAATPGPICLRRSSWSGGCSIKGPTPLSWLKVYVWGREIQNTASSRSHHGFMREPQIVQLRTILNIWLSGEAITPQINGSTASSQSPIYISAIGSNRLIARSQPQRRAIRRWATKGKSAFAPVDCMKCP